MKRFLSWPVIVVLSAGVADLLVWMNTGSPAQVAVVLWFLFVCPGMVAVRFLHLKEPLVEWMLAITLSLAIDTFVAGFLLVVRSWSPQNAFSIILILTVVGAVIEAARLSSVWRAWMKGFRAFVSALSARDHDGDSVHEASSDSSSQRRPESPVRMAALVRNQAIPASSDYSALVSPGSSMASLAHKTRPAEHAYRRYPHDYFPRSYGMVSTVEGAMKSGDAR